MSFQDKVNGAYINTLYKNYGKEIGAVTSKKESVKAMENEKISNQIKEDNELEV